MAINLSYSTEQRKYQGSANEALLYGVNQLEERALKNQTKVDALDDHLNTIQSQLYSGYINDFKTKADKYKTNISSFLEKGDMADIGSAIFNWGREIKNDEQTNNQITSSKNFNIYSAQLMQDDKIDPIFKKEFFMPNGTADQLMANGGQRPVDIKEFGNLDIPQQKDVRGYLEKIKASYLPNSSSVSTSDLFASAKGQEKVEALGLGSTIGVDKNNKSLLQSGRYSETRETITYDGLGKIIMKQMTDPKTEVGAYIKRLSEAMTKVQGKTITPEDIVHSYADNEYDPKTGNFSIDEEQTRVKSETTELETNWMYNLVEANNERYRKQLELANQQKQTFQQYTEVPSTRKQLDSVETINGAIADKQLEINSLLFENRTTPPTKETWEFSSKVDSYIKKKDYEGLKIYLKTANTPELNLPATVPQILDEIINVARTKDEIETKVYGADYNMGMTKPIYGKEGPTREEFIDKVNQSKEDGYQGLLEQFIAQTVDLKDNRSDVHKGVGEKGNIHIPTPYGVFKKGINIPYISTDEMPMYADAANNKYKTFDQFFNDKISYLKNRGIGLDIINDPNKLSEFKEKYGSLFVNEDGSLIDTKKAYKLNTEFRRYSDKVDEINETLLNAEPTKDVVPLFQFNNDEDTKKLNEYIITSTNNWNPNLETYKFRDENMNEIEQPPSIAKDSEILNLGNFYTDGKFYAKYKLLKHTTGGQAVQSEEYNKEIPLAMMRVASTDGKNNAPVAQYNERVVSAIIQDLENTRGKVDLTNNLQTPVPVAFRNLIGDSDGNRYSIETFDRNGNPIIIKRQTQIDIVKAITDLLQ